MNRLLVALVSLALGCLVAASYSARSITVFGFESPESVLHDTVANVYLVSNVGAVDWDHGGPAAVDHNGSISRVWPDGKVEHDWIMDGKNGVTLNGPMGLGLHGNVLYVADIDTLRRFDRASGQPIGDVAMPNPLGLALCLNDVTVTSDGTVFVSDSENNVIFKVNVAGQVSVWSMDPALGCPNGLVAEGTDGVAWVQWYGTGRICRLGANQEVSVIGSFPTADPGDPGMFFDGLVRKTDGSFLVSSWLTGAVHQVSATGVMLGVVAQFGDSWEFGPADIGIDYVRNRLLVPLFLGDALVIQEL